MKKSSTPADQRRDRYHHGDLPAALKAAALDLITSRGVEGFSLREAALAVKVSPSAAYRHFASKDDLLGALAEDAFAELAESFRGAVDAVVGKSGTKKFAIERFKAMGRAYVRFALDHPRRFQAMYGLSDACTARRKVHREATAAGDAKQHSDSAAYVILAALLDDLLTAGVIGKAARVDAGVTAWSAIHGLAHLLVSGMLPVSSKEAIVVMSDLVVVRVIHGLKE
jgi:AcrR family transcriptional regulator